MADGGGAPHAVPARNRCGQLRRQPHDLIGAVSERPQPTSFPSNTKRHQRRDRTTESLKRQNTEHNMSFDRLSSLEAQSGTPGGYSDDPGFQDLLHELRTKLRDLEKNIVKLRTDVNLLGTRRDTARVRERVHGLLETSREQCRGLGEGVKKLQGWEDLSVRQSCP